MKAHSIRVFVVAGLVGVGSIVLFLTPARSQIQVAPNYIPIGVAASGGSSTAWFHQPSSGRVVACQSAFGSSEATSSIHCVSAKMP